MIQPIIWNEIASFGNLQYIYDSLRVSKQKKLLNYSYL